ncbi:amidohydrolase [Nocardia bovistercoris]|uniref:Amidohydrolase n=1 Tax=Nocardia bovistercoris TaxID=2785916 RepID=A0A931I7V2_9NOCA|nr:amidohydrolase [Nocardia bovistercoris]MBH0776547.1 amidohydrolase [Nocardia bovistercoris]
MSTADMIFTGGPVITVDPDHPAPGAVAVTGGRITAVGGREVLDLRGPRTEIIDLEGRCLMPGFVEAHTHPTQEQTLYSDAVVDIRPVTTCPTAQRVYETIRTALDAAPEGAPIIFYGLDLLLQKGFPEPTRASLDELGRGRAIIVWQNSGHLAWANSAALAAAGLNGNTPDPMGGTFERDTHGILTGRVYEAPAVLAVVAPILAAELEGPDLLARQHADLASRGVTLCSDMAFSDRMRPITASLYQQGRAKVRMRVYEMSTPDGVTYCPINNGDDMFRQIGIKLWVDGSPWIGNIDTSFPYLDTAATAALGLGHNHRGHANYTAEQLHSIVLAYFPHGWQMACHVHGDRGVDTILDAYEQILTTYPRPDHRLRLEHCGAMTPEQFRRASELGVTCSLFIDHLYYWGDVLVDDLFGPDHGAHWVRTKSALDANMRISFHNDAPVTEEEPLRNISAAITRKSRTGRVLAPEERITLTQALRAQTIDAAYQLFADDITGSITPGKYADLVVLEQDPRATPPEDLPQIGINTTFLSGTPTFTT